jgi:hypothetical protein
MGSAYSGCGRMISCFEYRRTLRDAWWRAMIAVLILYLGSFWAVTHEYRRLIYVIRSKCHVGSSTIRWYTRMLKDVDRFLVSLINDTTARQRVALHESSRLGWSSHRDVVSNTTMLHLNCSQVNMNRLILRQFLDAMLSGHCNDFAQSCSL